MTRKLGDILIQQGVIDEEKLMAALSDQRAFGGKLGRTLVDLGYVTEEGYRIFYGQAMEDVKAWLAGQPVRVLRA